MPHKKLNRYRAVILVPRELHCHASDIEAAQPLLEEMVATVFSKHRVKHIGNQYQRQNNVWLGIERIDD